MAAVSHRHRGNYAAPHKTLPITMPTKAPAYNYPVSRVAMSPPELSDTSTISGSRRSGNSGGTFSARSSNYAPSHRSGDDYETHYSASGVDVMDMLNDRMNNMAFDPMRMDRSLAKQTQQSGELNAKQRELAELQAMAQRRLKTARVNFAEGMDAAREARADIDYSSKKISSMKSRASRAHPEAYERVRTRRQ